MSDFKIGDEVHYIVSSLGVVSADSLELISDRIIKIDHCPELGRDFDMVYIDGLGCKIPARWCYKAREDCIDAFINRLVRILHNHE